MIYRGERATVSFADEIVVVSKELQSYFWKTYGIETRYIPTAPATYHESDPSLPYLTTLGLEPQRYILFLGRLVPEKRPDLLLEAFLKLQPPGWKLVLAGGASDTPSFRAQLVQMTQGNPQVTFTGEIHGQSVAEIVRGAGLFVLPSDVEGLPLVMLEAMRENIPVLASNIPPHQQLIGEDRGLLFQAGNLESCIQGLNQALSQPEQLAAMALQAQDYVKQNHSWDHIAFENLSLYAKIGKKLRTVDSLNRVPVANETEELDPQPKWTGVDLPRDLSLTNVTDEVPPLFTRCEEGVVASHPD